MHGLSVGCASGNGNHAATGHRAISVPAIAVSCLAASLPFAPWKLVWPCYLLAPAKGSLVVSAAGPLARPRPGPCCGYMCVRLRDVRAPCAPGAWELLHLIVASAGIRPQLAFPCQVHATGRQGVLMALSVVYKQKCTLRCPAIRPICMHPFMSKKYAKHNTTGRCAFQSLCKVNLESSLPLCEVRVL